MAALPRLHRRALSSSALAAAGLLVALGVLALLLARGQAQAREDLRTRFALRAELAAGFIESLVAVGHDLSQLGEVREVDAHLGAIVPVPGQRAYLVDEDGLVLAASVATSVGVMLPAVEPALDSPEPGATPTYHGIRHPGEHVAAAAAVGEGGMLVVITVPTAQLYAPLVGTVWPQWLVYTLFALAGVWTIVLLFRLEARRAELDWALRVDPLTGVRNRRHLQERLPEVASGARRHGREWAVLMVDVDHFKRINDEEGHASGDEVLRRVARELVTEVRREDLAGRWGGDEFLVILPESDCDGAVRLGERILARVRDRIGPHRTLSIGCAAGIDEPEELLRRADDALYEAKRLGRSRVAAQPAQASGRSGEEG